MSFDGNQSKLQKTVKIKIFLKIKFVLIDRKIFNIFYLENDIVLKTHSAVDVVYVKPISKGQCKNKEIYEKCQPGICIEKANNYGCVCPYSFKANSNEHECIRGSFTIIL